MVRTCDDHRYQAGYVLEGWPEAGRCMVTDPSSTWESSKNLGKSVYCVFCTEGFDRGFYTLLHYGLNLKEIKHFEYLSEEIKCGLMQKTTDAQSSSRLSPERCFPPTVFQPTLLEYILCVGSMQSYAKTS